MGHEAVDTTIPLDWDETAGAWPFTLLDHDWAEMKALLREEGDHRSRVPEALYHVERSPQGAHRVRWTGPAEERPSRVWGLAAVNPKPRDSYWGIPIPLLAASLPVLGAIVTLLLNSWLAPASTCSPETVCPASQDFVARSDYLLLEGSLAENRAQLEELAPWQERHRAETALAVDRPSDDRILYLLGQSHGLRLEALRALHRDDSLARELSLGAETAFINSALGVDTDASIYTQGKSLGQKDALRLLGLGELTTLEGRELGLGYH